MYSLQLQIPVAAKPLSLTLSSSCPNINPNFSCKTNSPLSRFRLATRHKCGVSVSDNEKSSHIELPAGLEAELMPKQVAVMMDGNRRWAIERGLPPQHGHRVGVETMKELVRNCYKYGVKVVTVVVASTENWIRPQEEVAFVKNLFQEVIISDTDILMEKDVRLSFIGNKDQQLPESLRKLMLDVEERTKENKRMQFVVALNYGGRYDITKATKTIVSKVKDGVLQVEDINDAVFEQHLEINGLEFPNPDLMIRSGGELRLSNFLLWQFAYTEMFFTKKLWPDFNETDFFEAITAFQRRQRRFGGHKH